MLRMINNIKTILLLGILSILLILIGGFLGGNSGSIIAFGIALVMNGVGYFFADKIALKSSHAEPLSEEEAPEIYSIVRDLTLEMKLPMPDIYLIPTSQANAFATGRNPNHASIAVTQGLLNILDRNEIKAVLAHELGHVKNNDILITSIAAVLASAITFLSRIGYFSGGDNENRSSLGFLTIFLAPLAAMLIQLAVSRTREYQADKSGAEMLHTGEPLAEALKKISNSVTLHPDTAVNPAFSSLYIINPLKGIGESLTNLFSTHPPVRARIERLEEMHFA